MFIDSVNKILALGTIVSQIFILCTVLYAIFLRKDENVISKFITKHGLLLAFIVALGSMGSSLFYSNIAGFPPCDLCWFQRIFMYPMVFLLGLALFKKHARRGGGDSNIADYGLILAVIGGVISLYHNYMYYYNQGLNVFCQLGGIQVSCVKRYVLEFGYVTIPMMALTAFVLTIIFLVAYRFYNKKTI